MKLIILPLLLLYSFSTISEPPVIQSSQTGSMSIIVNNIDGNKGDILIGVFDDPDVFLERGKFLVGKVYPVENEGTMTFTIPDIPYGTYAVAVYHDQDGDTYLGKNIFGVPNEPYGFYKDVRGKWSEPLFSEASFDFIDPDQDISIELKYWADR